MGLLNLHNGPFNTRIRRIFDADALAYITEAGYTNFNLKIIIDNCFIDLKATGQFSKISLMKLFITDSLVNATALTQCGINAVAPLLNVPTYFGNPTANYSGISYNGLTQYARMNYNPLSDNKWGLNNATLMGYVGFNNTSFFIGARNAQNYLNPSVYLSTQINGFNDVGLNAYTNGTFFAPNQNPSGFLAISRTLNNGLIYWCRNNNLNLSTNHNAQAIPDINLFEGGVTIDGGLTIAVYANQRVQFILTGSGMSTSEMNAVQLVVNKLQGDLDTLWGLTGSAARKRY